MSELHVEENSDDFTPLEIGAEWVKNFINGLGGDFSIIENDGFSIVLQNERSCPGTCIGKKDNSTCNEIEKTLCDAVQYFDNHLTAGFTVCSNETGNGCLLTISFNP